MTLEVCLVRKKAYLMIASPSIREDRLRQPLGLGATGVKGDACPRDLRKAPSMYDDVDCKRFRLMRGVLFYWTEAKEKCGEGVNRPDERRATRKPPENCTAFSTTVISTHMIVVEWTPRKQRKKSLYGLHVPVPKPFAGT